MVSNTKKVMLVGVIMASMSASVSPAGQQGQSNGFGLRGAFAFLTLGFAAGAATVHYKAKELKQLKKAVNDKWVSVCDSVRGYRDSVCRYFAPKAARVAQGLAQHAPAQAAAAGLSSSSAVPLQRARMMNQDELDRYAEVENRRYVDENSVVPSQQTFTYRMNDNGAPPAYDAIVSNNNNNANRSSSRQGNQRRNGNALRPDDYVNDSDFHSLDLNALSMNNVKNKKQGKK